MRILIIHPHLFVKGGGERLTAILASGLPDLGHQTAILTASIRDGFASLANTKVITIRELIPQSELLPERILSIALSIRRAIKEEQPQAIISMTEDILNLGLSKFFSRGVKTIQYIHFPQEEELGETQQKGLYKRYFRFPEWLNRRFLWASDHLLCNSLYTREAIKRYWQREATVVYPPLAPVFMERPPNLEEPRENILLSVGRFTPLKRQDFLIRSFKEIRGEVKDARLILAGFIDERHAGYFAEVSSCQDESIEFRINPSDEDLLQLYRRAKLFCHPRIGEHFGLSPIEAMSQGVPVVAYNSGGITEVITHRKDGFLVGSDEEFKSCMREVLLMDPERWLELQAEAHRRAHFFSPERFIEGFEQCLKG